MNIYEITTHFLFNWGKIWHQSERQLVLAVY